VCREVAVPPKKNRPGKTPVKVQVQEVRPLITGTGGAALMLGRSETALRVQRNADRALIEQGRKPLGPRWITIGKSVFYKLSDLEDWLERNSVPCGNVPFRGFAPKAPAEVE
jgi:hypothetical protein